jgi:hypothetical protein
MEEKKVMTSTVTNESRTMVSFPGNSGETRHIPPHDSITIMTVEITENKKIHKLEELGFITVHHNMASAQEPASTLAKNKSARAQQPKQHGAQEKE